MLQNIHRSLGRLETKLLVPAWSSSICYPKLSFSFISHPLTCTFPAVLLTTTHYVSPLPHHYPFLIVLPPCGTLSFSLICHLPPTNTHDSVFVTVPPTPCMLAYLQVTCNLFPLLIVEIGLSQALLLQSFLWEFMDHFYLTSTIPLTVFHRTL
jgi:hypothetical protein